jgi:hypothetical protein
VAWFRAATMEARLTNEMNRNISIGISVESESLGAQTKEIGGWPAHGRP